MVKNHTVKSVPGTLLLLLIFIINVSALDAQTAEDFFNKGLESFKWQKAEEALGFFQQASDADPGKDLYFLFLGVTCHQMGRLQDAEESYTRGIALNGSERDRLLLNRGNLRVILGNYDGASSDYLKVVEARGPLSASALLNRANMEVNRGSFSLAAEDYSNYLAAEPDSLQKEKIERLITLLNNRLASDAAAAAAAAEQARAEEERKLAEEAARAEEEARRAALMEEALQSLSDSGEDTSNISAGSEKIREDFEDSALED